MLDAWSETLGMGVPLDAVYFDFAKAFNTVPHHSLLTKLGGYGIRGKMLEWMD